MDINQVQKIIDAISGACPDQSQINIEHDEHFEVVRIDCDGLRITIDVEGLAGEE